MRPSIPNKYSEERVSTILLRIRYGCSQRKAAEYAGVSERTLHFWRKRYPHFDAAVREAVVTAENDRVNALLDTA